MAIIGKDVTLTARVANISDAQGVYTAVFSIDGNEAERKDLAMPAGSTQTVVFKFTPSANGDHVIKVGDTQLSLAVKKTVQKEIQLKYDSGTPRDALSVDGGYAIDFSPPSVPMIIKQVSIAAMFSPKADKSPVNNSFDLEILDKGLKPIYGATYPYNQFSSSAVNWVTFSIPDVQVDGQFYVIVYSKSPLYALYMGADDSTLNEHSDLASRDAAGNIQIASQWLIGAGRQNWFADKSKVNWMIRVTGVAQVPED
jgi:hypothetical protein